MGSDGSTTKARARRWIDDDESEAMGDDEGDDDGESEEMDRRRRRERGDGRRRRERGDGTTTKTRARRWIDDGYEIAERSEIESDGACIVRGRWQRLGAHEGFSFASLIRFFH